MDIKEAMDVIIQEMRREKRPGSYYHSWQSNIACAIYDNSEIGLEQANFIATTFLDNLIR